MRVRSAERTGRRDRGVQRAPSFTPGQRLVDVRGVDDGRAGQHRLRRQLGAEVDVAVEQRHREEALQVGLLVDREQLRAALDAVEVGLVHVERAKLDAARRTGLHDPVGGAVGVAGADGDDAVDVRVLQELRLDRLGDGGRVAEGGRRQRQLLRRAASCRSRRR